MELAPLISPEDNYRLAPDETAFLAFLSGTSSATAEAGYDVLLPAATCAAEHLP
jgi:hypothetical protein